MAENKDNNIEQMAEAEVAPKKTRMSAKRLKAQHAENNWGGAREGSGRKASGNAPKVPIGFSLSARAKTQKEFLQSKGVNPAELIEKAFDNAARVLGWVEQ